MKLRSLTSLGKLSRAEMLTRLQIIRVVDPLVSSAYRVVEDRRWRGQEDDNPHGQPWHVSHHASQFPGDDSMACPRQSLYRMMDFPAADAFSRKARALMAAGKAIETELVDTWDEAGILISASTDSETQTNFELPGAWLTGSVDSVILPEGWNRPLPVEVKTKYQHVLDEMRTGAVGPDQPHISQLKVQLALVRIYQQDLWPDLDPVTHGYLFYMSRDDPSCTAEFRIDYDQKFFDVGAERLKQWAKMFRDNELPTINPSKRHPLGWRWSYKPCVWCPFKKTCQLDHQQGVETLTDSVGVERAKLVRPKYDPQAARERVFERWKGSQ